MSSTNKESELNAHRAFNNVERANAAILRNSGFEVFCSGNVFYAKHVKLICQYEITTCCDQAINDLFRYYSSPLRNQPDFFKLSPGLIANI